MVTTSRATRPEARPAAEANKAAAAPVTNLPAQTPEIIQEDPEPQSEPVSQPVTMPETPVIPEEPVVAEEPLTVVSPLEGDVVAAFSMDQLLYNETLEDWRTHDGMDIAAAEGEERRIADPEKGDLSPEWNLDWALQRMRAINLLRYAPVDYQYSYLSGSTHDGKPSSPSASIASALKGAHESVSSGTPASYVTNIYGPDHGWRKGSYCCDVTICKTIFAVLPENFTPDGNVWLFLRVAGPGGDDANFSGSGVSLGMNRFLADADGVFVTFPDNDIGSGVEWPTTDHNTYGGWVSTWCGAFADYSSLFQFKEDDGDEP